MSLYLEKYESELSKKFIKNGYVILKKKNLTNLKYIRSLIIKKSAQILGIKPPNDKASEKFLNNIHKDIKIKPSIIKENLVPSFSLLLTSIRPPSNSTYLFVISFKNCLI